MNVTVVIPTFNSAPTIRQCLESLLKQNYPMKMVEILVVDDESTDNTVEIAKEYPVRILVNGYRNIEIGKSIGLRSAKGELVLFMDSDVILTSSRTLLRLVEPFLRHPELVGSTAAWFHYDRHESLPDRYSSLFGVHDPLAFYLKVGDRFMWIENKWHLLGKAEDQGDYFLVEFGEGAMPTIGGTLFLARRDLLLKTEHDPYFFHMDSFHQLIQMGFSKFCYVKDSFIHQHSTNVWTSMRKLRRNCNLYLIQRSSRKFTWVRDLRELGRVALLMVLLVKPMLDSTSGYRKLQDVAWFFNPLVCEITVLVYGLSYVLWKLRTWCMR